MGEPTPTDELAASKYAFASLTEKRFTENSLPFDNSLMEWKENVETYYCPPLLQKKCPRRVLRFTKRGCITSSCWNFNASSGDPMEVNPNNPYCTDTHDRTASVFHEWRSGKCVAANPLLKVWAEYPHQRRDKKNVPGVTNAPPFVYHQDAEEDEDRVEIPRHYCEDFMKVSYDPDNKRCYLTNSQSIAEMFIGTIYRGFF